MQVFHHQSNKPRPSKSEVITSVITPNYIRALDQGGQPSWETEPSFGRLIKQLESSLKFFVLSTRLRKAPDSPEIIATARGVEENQNKYSPYNILPLDAAGAWQSIMQLEEVKAAISALWNIRCLTWPVQHRQRTIDLFDWLFGFQKDNV